MQVEKFIEGLSVTEIGIPELTRVTTKAKRKVKTKVDGEFVTKTENVIEVEYVPTGFYVMESLNGTPVYNSLGPDMETDNIGFDQYGKVALLIVRNYQEIKNECLEAGRVRDQE